MIDGEMNGMGAAERAMRQDREHAEAAEHALARLRAAIDASRDNGWRECVLLACRYLRTQSEDLPVAVRVHVLRLAGDLGDDLHRGGRP